MGRDLERNFQFKLISYWSDMFQKEKKNHNNWQISSAQAKKERVAIIVLQSVLCGWRQPCWTMLRKEERKQERLTVSLKPCSLGQITWHRCSLVQRFLRRLWNLLWQLPETKIHLRNTPLPQFLSPVTKHIGSLYIMYWHQELQLLHIHPILKIIKSTDECRSLCSPRFKKN